MRQLAAHPRQNGVAAALRELGRMERTLFTLDWIDDPDCAARLGRSSTSPVALQLQRPLPDDALMIVARGAKQDP
jgi:hypothetical protein